ncbi:HNH endonuclease [Nocardia sp. NPDC004573]
MGGDYLTPVDVTSKQIQGGHATRPVRVRIGQRAFRNSLLANYGERCAFTGDLPPAVLEACHLYSYAQIGKHHEHGGILLRRDLHTLFDRGVITVDKHDRIDLAEQFHEFQIYRDLHQQPLSISLSDEQRRWFSLHWSQYRKS